MCLILFQSILDSMISRICIQSTFVCNKNQQHSENNFPDGYYTKSIQVQLQFQDQQLISRYSSDPMGQTEQITEQAAALQSKTTLFHEYEGHGFYLAQFKTPELAIFSYYLQSQNQAYLIDPTYDIYSYQQLAAKRKSKIIAVLLTHYHADYLAGHTQLQIPVIMGPKSAKDGAKIKLQQMQDGAVVKIGTVDVKIIHTPGHTLESTCFQLNDSDHKPVCLFTGDTIFLGEVGRPDLAVSSSVTKEELAKMLYQSLSKVKKQVDHSIRLYPTHGSGSACGKNIGQGNFCTLQKQLQKNYALKIDNEAQFVNKVLSQMPKPPSYFFHDAKLNQTGQATKFDEMLKNSQRSLSIQQFKGEMDKGCMIIDSRNDFGEKSIKGSYLMAEKGNLATWVGLLIDPQTKLLLICEKQKAKDLIERILRIGYFNIVGYNGFTIQQWHNKGMPIWEPKTSTARGMSQIHGATNLDVRNPGEWKSTGVIQGSKLISLGEISNRFEEVKGLNIIFVNCKTGLRARLASSILAQKGIPSIIVTDKFQDFSAAGVKIVQHK